MTDTGQIPGEGLPENAGGQPEGPLYTAPSDPVGTGPSEQPDTPVADAYAFHHQLAGSAEEDDQLLMPRAQGGWSDLPAGQPQEGPARDSGLPESAGYGTGQEAEAIDYGTGQAPQSGTAQRARPTPQPTAQIPPARRPLHLGPPVPEGTGGVVRSLADRGPTGATPPPVRHAGPPTLGPEYLDVTAAESVVVPEYAQQAAVLPGPQLGEIPALSVAWAPQQFQQPAVDPAGAGPALPQQMQHPVETMLEQEPNALPGTEHSFSPAGQPVIPVEPADPGERPAPAQAGEVVASPRPLPAAEAPQNAEPPDVSATPAEHQQPTGAQPVPEAWPVAGGVPVEDGAGTDASERISSAQQRVEPAAEDESAAEDEPAVADEPVERQLPVPGQEPERAGLTLVPDETSEQISQELPAAADEPAAATGEVEPVPVVAEDEPAVAPLEKEPAGAPAAGYGEAERAAVLRVMRERRDIRNGFRKDPIPHDVLLRVLEAAHTAPSVGHSQPWDFVVIRSADTRRTMHDLATRQREAYAKSLPKGRAKQFKELKIEAILDTPVNIVVTADPTRGGRHTLGRHTQPQMAPYSSALAVENLWLAARAEGLGVGWVSFFDEHEMVRELGLPDHLDVVAYLCVGYVDEFPDEPELMQAGWSKRRPLSWVVHEETYGRRALPGEDPHDLLAETLQGIRPLDAKALGEAWERQKRMTKPAGALGMLEIIAAQLSGLSRQCPPPIPEPAAVAVFAGDHGVHAQGVSPWPQEVTAQMVTNFLGGGAVCNAFANQVGAEVCIIDVGVAGELPSAPGLLPRKVRPGTDDFSVGPALSREDVLRAVEVGIETARDLVSAGNKALLTGEMGIANTTVSAALIAVYTGLDPAEVTGRGTGINDEMFARKVDVVRRALELHQPDPADPIGVLAAVGGLEHAALVGLVLGGASMRTPVILDGVSAGAAALVARAVAPEALAACIAGHRSAEPGHVAALTKLGLRPLVDLDLRLGEGTGALLALPVIQSAARAMHEVATFDAAGVTEK